MKILGARVTNGLPSATKQLEITAGVDDTSYPGTTPRNIHQASGHVLSEVEQVADRVAIMRRGHLMHVEDMRETPDSS